MLHPESSILKLTSISSANTRQQKISPQKTWIWEERSEREEWNYLAVVGKEWWVWWKEGNWALLDRGRVVEEEPIAHTFALSFPNFFSAFYSHFPTSFYFIFKLKLKQGISNFVFVIIQLF